MDIALVAAREFLYQRRSLQFLSRHVGWSLEEEEFNEACNTHVTTAGGGGALARNFWDALESGGMGVDDVDSDELSQS